MRPEPNPSAEARGTFSSFRSVPLDEWCAHDRAWRSRALSVALLPFAGVIAALFVPVGSIPARALAGLVLGLVASVLAYRLRPEKPRPARRVVSDAFAVDAVLADDARPFDTDGAHPLALRVDGDLRPATLLVHHGPAPTRAARIALFDADGAAMRPAAE